MQQISAEKFNSKTLKQFFSDPKFISNTKDTVIVKSKKTGEPVEVFVRKTMDGIGGVFNHYYDFFKSKENTSQKDLLAEKYFTITSKKIFTKIIPEFHIGMMRTKTDEYVGLGIRADELQIKEAISQGVDRIARASVPSAILYHLKMGYIPKQELVRIKNEASLKKVMNEIYEELPNINKEFFTPIIIEKNSFFGKKFFLDINNTKTIAFIRKSQKILKECPEKIKKPQMSGEIVDMELSGQELQMWKDAIEGKGCFDMLA